MVGFTRKMLVVGGELRTENYSGVLQGRTVVGGILYLVIVVLLCSFLL